MNFFFSVSINKIQIRDNFYLTHRTMAYVLVFNKWEHDHNCSGLWSGCLSCVHWKKRLAIFPSQAGMSLTKLFLAWKIIKLFPGRESLVSDIPAGDGKIDNLFYSVREVKSYSLVRRLRPHCPEESSCFPPYLQKNHLVKKWTFVSLRLPNEKIVEVKNVVSRIVDEIQPSG